MLFGLLAGLVASAAVAFVRWILWDPSEAEGMALNQWAWQASFTERGERPPENGPRAGWWNARVRPGEIDRVLGWRMPARRVTGLLEIDDRGIQRVPAPRAASRILIVGGSVAVGGYASRIETTWWHRLASALARAGSAVAIDVFAASAWKAEQEVGAMERYLAQEDAPDLALFLDGLNELTNGETARSRVEEEDAPHARDWSARVDVYLEHIRAAADRLQQANVPMVVVLQPALFEKPHRTELEEALLRSTVRYLRLGGDGVEQLKRHYGQMRRRLLALSERPGIYFIDCSRALSRAMVTTFADLWHFADAGHLLLARCVKGEVLSVVRSAVAGRSPSHWRRLR